MYYTDTLRFVDFESRVSRVVFNLGWTDSALVTMSVRVRESNDGDGYEHSDLEFAMLFLSLLLLDVAVGFCLACFLPSAARGRGVEL